MRSTYSLEDINVFFKAVREGELLNVGIYLTKIDVNVRNHHGDTPLHVAVAMEHLEVIRILIEDGAFLDVFDRESNTPLHLAVKVGHLPTIELLLDSGASVNAYCRDGYTALNAALVHEVSPLNPKVVELLLQRGADPNICKERGHSILIESLKKKDMDTIISLLKHGANVNYSVMRGLTALHVAARFNTQEVIDLLLDYGADITAVNHKGESAIDWANTEEIKCFLQEKLRLHKIKECML